MFIVLFKENVATTTGNNGWMRAVELILNILHLRGFFSSFICYLFVGWMDGWNDFCFIKEFRWPTLMRTWNKLYAKLNLKQIKSNKTNRICNRVPKRSGLEELGNAPGNHWARLTQELNLCKEYLEKIRR